MTLNPQTVHVELGSRSYDIQIGSGNLYHWEPLLTRCPQATHAVIITDTNVDPLFGDKLADYLADQNFEIDLMIVDAGEPSKSPEVAHELWERMLEEGTDRQSIVVALGGGVVGDLAGFVAATYSRGLRLLQIPTTLLAQVDSSVGGKVGINLPQAKNMVGAFWQPLGVVIDVDTLNTLPDREYRAGLAEVVKYGMILDHEFFVFLEQNIQAIQERDAGTLQTIIHRCCRLKADVVENDEREESGHRIILNYGHTFCHAMEAASGYQKLLHGEGVAIGMLCASRLAELLGRIDSTTTQRQFDLLTALQLPTQVPDLDTKELLRLMYHDKKTNSGCLRFVLPSRIGHVELVDDVGDAQVLSALVNPA